MATDLTAEFTLTGGGVLTNTLDMAVVSSTLNVGQNGFDAITHSFANGTGDGQATVLWSDERTLAATTGESLDLYGVLINPATGAVINFSKIKLVLIDIDTPNGVKSLRVGPQGVSNAWQGWHGGVAAGNYDTVSEFLYQVNRYSGWTVTSGTADLLRIYNPGAGSVTYRILLIGTE